MTHETGAGGGGGVGREKKRNLIFQVLQHEQLCLTREHLLHRVNGCTSSHPFRPWMLLHQAQAQPHTNRKRGLWASDLQFLPCLGLVPSPSPEH